MLLTGGASTRMGTDKASLVVDGVPLAELVARRLLEAGYAVTVCGLKPIEGCAFIPDAAVHAGPLAALAPFKPRTSFVFVSACDLSCFDARLVAVLRSLIGLCDAAVPTIAGRLQPLAALYSERAFPIASQVYDQGKRSVMAWLDALRVQSVDETTFVTQGIALESLASANTPEELARLSRP